MHLVFLSLVGLIEIILILFLKGKILIKRKQIIKKKTVNNKIITFCLLSRIVTTIIIINRNANLVFSSKQKIITFMVILTLKIQKIYFFLLKY